MTRVRGKPHSLFLLGNLRHVGLITRRFAIDLIVEGFEGT